MKFTREEAFEKLKSHLTNNGRKTLRMSEKSLNAQIDTLLPLIADEEMELDTFFDKVKASFETMNANAEKDKADFIKEWKKNNPPKSDDDEGDEAKDGKGKNDGEKTLLERIAALEGRIAEEEKAKTIGQKRKELKAKMKEKGIDDSDWADMMVSEISVSDDLDVEAKADSLLKIYNKQKSATSRDWTPGTPSGTTNNKDTFADVKALFKQRQETMKQNI